MLWRHFLYGIFYFVSYRNIQRNTWKYTWRGYDADWVYEAVRGYFIADLIFSLIFFTSRVSTVCPISLLKLLFHFDFSFSISLSFSAGLLYGQRSATSMKNRSDFFSILGKKFGILGKNFRNFWVLIIFVWNSAYAQPTYLIGMIKVADNIYYCTKN